MPVFYPEEWEQMGIEDEELQKQLEKDFLANIVQSNSDYEQFNNSGVPYPY